MSAGRESGRTGGGDDDVEAASLSVEISFSLPFDDEEGVLSSCSGRVKVGSEKETAAFVVGGSNEMFLVCAIRPVRPREACSEAAAYSF